MKSLSWRRVLRWIPVQGVVLAGLGLLSTGGGAGAAVTTWLDQSGRPVEAEFVRIQGGRVFLRPAGGEVTPVPMQALSAESQQQARAMWAQHLNEAVQTIDGIVDKALKERGIAPNPRLDDYSFVRRAYLDIAGSIPTYEQVQEFTRASGANKRAQLIAKLLSTEGYVSHSYNYWAEQLRIQNVVPGRYLGLDPYINWIKTALRDNMPFDQMVLRMLTATGRVWDDPAAGYQLRDWDMPGDHVSYTTQVFLGTDITCAQCHDHPFEDWTQMDYYMLWSFLSEKEVDERVEVKLASGAEDEIRTKLIARHNIDVSTEDGRAEIGNRVGDVRRTLGWFRDATALVLRDSEGKELRLPDDYKYEDAEPGQAVDPLPLFGELPEAAEGKSKREQFALWLVDPENPRFAMNIANRIWARLFGRGIAEPIHNINPETAYIPELLEYLEKEMIHLGFDMKVMTQIVMNTRAYQREATRTYQSEADPYYFPGPVLRRMSAEQIWDSLMTLMVADPMRFRAGDNDYYSETVNLLTAPSEGLSADEVLERVDAYTRYNFLRDNIVEAARYAQMKSGSEEGDPRALDTTPTGGSRLDAAMAGEQMMMEQSESVGGEYLLRASELPQPVPDSHFLSKFGASNRTFLVGASSTQGSVPQVLELMNGRAVNVITGKDSLIFKRMQNISNVRDRGYTVFVSVLNRRPTAYEMGKLAEAVTKNGENGYSDLIWALLNSPEFFFIK
jgi:hypothetical protein